MKRLARPACEPAGGGSGGHEAAARLKPAPATAPTARFPNGDGMIDFVVPVNDVGTDGEHETEEDYTVFVSLVNETPAAAGTVRRLTVTGRMSS